MALSRRGKKIINILIVSSCCCMNYRRVSSSGTVEHLLNAQQENTNPADLGFYLNYLQNGITNLYNERTVCVSVRVCPSCAHRFRSIDMKLGMGTSLHFYVFKSISSRFRHYYPFQIVFVSAKRVRCKRKA